MLVRLMYASRAADSVNSDALHAILRQSQRNNPTLGITGLLCYSGGVFMQVLEGGRHTVNIDMEPFVNRTSQPSRYRLSAYLFFYRAPRSEHDATLEAIIAPSTLDEHSRLNPVCDNPQIVIRNSGRAPLRSARFICALKPPPPACSTTAKPAARNSSPSANAYSSVPSPWCTR